MAHSTSCKHDTRHILQSLIVNSLIAAAKGFAAFMTGSGAMLAETIHSVADCGNQGLLLLGVSRSKRPADEMHPFGYGRLAYFWSFMVAMLLFSVGGMFSIYEGIHKYNNPEPVQEIAWGIGVLAFAILLEGYATISNIKVINKRKGKSGFFHYIRSTKESDLIVVFGENSAAVLGLVLALFALLTAHYTGDARFDALGSLAIGVVLILVAIFLAIEVKSLLIGESADPAIVQAAKKIAADQPEITGLLSCKTVQQGPGKVLVCVKVKLHPDISSKRVSILINDFETALREINPGIQWLYVEPDLQEED